MRLFVMTRVRRMAVRAVLAYGLGMCVCAGFCAILSADDSQKSQNQTQLGVRENPLSPDESAAQIQLAAGYHFKLIATEPQVVSPVDAALDDRGRLWVVEMIDYPFRKPDQGEPRGRIRVLEDKDRDGRFESAGVFADKLDMPTGLAMWKDGVLVTLGGQLEWMRDTDGDGAVDHREVWLEGFAQQNEQLRANHPRVEMDGRIYVASGLRGGRIQVGAALRGDKPAEPFELGTRDVRLDPRTGQAEAITGPAQFGLTSDLTGTRMFCSNRNPCTQVVFEQSLLANNPLAGIVPAIHDALPAGEASKVYPLVAAWTTSNLHAGQFTAACGVHFQHVSATASMSDEQLKRIQAETLGQVFVCEPTGSLVHMQPVTHKDALWQVDSQSSTDKSEWLASRDSWFRPVNIISAPGGGVLVIDMHRAVIEHPAWVPDELKNRPDERFGEQAGRIYWVAPEQNAWPRELLSSLSESPLSARPVEQLVEAIRSDDAWLRRMAARLIIERDQVEAIAELNKLVAKDTTASVESQVIAWQLLALLDPAARGQLQTQLTDYHRLIQVTALRMLPRLPAANNEQIEVDRNATRTALQLAMETADPWLRLEATTTAARAIESLSPEDAQHAAAGLGKLAARHPHDPHLLIAAAGAARGNTSEFLCSWLDGLGQLKDSAIGKVGEDLNRDRWITAAAKQLVGIVDKAQPDTRAEVIARVRYLLTTEDSTSPISRLAALTVLGQSTRTQVAAEIKAKGQTASSGEQPIDALTVVDRPLWRKVRETARLNDSPPAVRVAAVELLGLSQRKLDRKVLASLVSESEDNRLRSAALKAWCEQGSSEAEEYLISQVATAGPAVRPILLEQILAKADRQAALLELMNSGKFSARQLGAVELKRFVDRSQGKAKEGFQKQLDSILNSNRAAVIKNYQPCLDMPGDAGRGKQIFVKQCAACHKIGDAGVQVGPDISDSRVQTADKLLTSILDPNRAIDNNYFRFVALTTDGRTIDGIIAEETADKVVIRAQNDQRHVLSRQEIEDLKATGVSMMPEGLESQIDQQGMADLIAYIKNWRYTAGQVPSTVKAGK